MTNPSDYSSTAIYLKNRPKYYKNQKKLIEAHQNKVASIEFRLKVLYCTDCNEGLHYADSRTTQFSCNSLIL